MAGRGTDILLGGNPEYLAAAELANKAYVVTKTLRYTNRPGNPHWSGGRRVALTRPIKSAEAGGLYVLGTERHDSRRIDNQLRGRSGRQGDPGESRFYLSLQDELMRRFNSAAVEMVMNGLRVPEDVPIESKLVSRQIQGAQTQLEQQNAEIRKNVLKYDEVLNKQRQVIYAERKEVLEGADIADQVRGMIDDVIAERVLGGDRRGIRRRLGS